MSDACTAASCVAALATGTATASCNDCNESVHSHHPFSQTRPAASRIAPMPDVANEHPARVAGTLDLVGMSDIEVPVRLPGGTVIPARADAFVSLDDPQAKGIHMSRLFLILQEELEASELSCRSVARILRRFIESHEGLSATSRVRLDYELMLRRPALRSQNRAWRGYPVSLAGTLSGDHMVFEFDVRVTYSSTCPCSAALARQLIQEAFQKAFQGRSQVDVAEMQTWLGREDAICATPHSQRSHADLKVIVTDPDSDLTHEQLIDLVEGALKTPVQAAVKREDEQEFARLNGQNLMFCEDAARRVKAALDADQRISDFLVRASHYESLHPHDAVSIVTKGVAGGLRG
jgi:GTP cyclohydrolase I